MFAAKNELLTRPNGGYKLTRSLRFRSSASAYLNRTPATAGNRKTWTWSGWAKRGSMGAFVSLFSSTNGTNGESTKTYIAIDASDLLTVGYGAAAFFTTTQVFRDPAAWYHIVVAFDSTQATAANRVKVYVNGTQVTAYSVGTSVTLNVDSAVNFTYSHSISALTGPSNYFDGYLTDVNFIDGQALNPSSFGAFNDYNVWQPKKYGGTYGTNGFYLPFTNNASAATLGNDFSGNSNTWTTNNISVTAGSTYDSMTDVPTLTSATASNYAVLNPLSNDSTNTLSNANLTYSIAANGNGYPTSTIQFNANKYYWECTVTSTHNIIGIVLGTTGTTTQLFSTGYGYYAVTGNKYVNGTSSAYGSTYTTGDVIGVAVDMTALTITFYKNNTSQGAISIAAGLYKIAGGNGNSTAVASGS